MYLHLMQFSTTTYVINFPFFATLFSRSPSHGSAPYGKAAHRLFKASRPRVQSSRSLSATVKAANAGIGTRDAGTDGRGGPALRQNRIPSEPVFRSSCACVTKPDRGDLARRREARRADGADDRAA